jgi:hypothetical protein
MAETFAVMARPKGAQAYAPAGHVALRATPARGQMVTLERAGRAIAAIVDQVFIPPGCEENCTGTLFVSDA